MLDSWYCVRGVYSEKGCFSLSKLLNFVTHLCMSSRNFLIKNCLKLIFSVGREAVVSRFAIIRPALCRPDSPTSSLHSNLCQHPLHRHPQSTVVGQWKREFLCHSPAKCSCSCRHSDGRFPARRWRDLQLAHDGHQQQVQIARLVIRIFESCVCVCAFEKVIIEWKNWNNWANFNQFSWTNLRKPWKAIRIYSQIVVGFSIHSVSWKNWDFNLSDMGFPTFRTFLVYMKRLRKKFSSGYHYQILVNA